MMPILLNGWRGLGCALAAVAAAPLFAQRVDMNTPEIRYLQRRIERGGTLLPGAPIRRLPRLDRIVPLQEPLSAIKLQQFIEQAQKAAPPPRMPGEDRVRPLTRSFPETTPVPALPPEAVTAALYPRPRPRFEDPTLEGVLPTFRLPAQEPEETTVPTRWRVGLPSWQSGGWRRYEDKSIDAIYTRPRLWDPFNQNVLKGDLPLFGRSNFFNFTGSSNTLIEGRRLPVPSGQSTADPLSPDFFGHGEEFVLQQSFRLSFDLFRGSAGFKPVEYEFRFTPEFNLNYLKTQENGLTRIDVRQGIQRTDSTVGIQELFFEKRLFTNSIESFRPRKDNDERGSAYFDFTSVRLGIQRFTSDFRGFVFSDEQPGARLFGTFGSNRYQYNLAYFNMLDKDSNTGLNNWRRRNQSVYVANAYWEDFFTQGYNLNFSLLYNNDQPSFHVDKNGFLVRPAPIGFPVTHKIRAAYAGISGDGHIGRINISHAFYQAFGRDDFNPVPAMKNPQHINAQLAALELAYEKDWATYKVSAFFTSGDRKLNDGRANGFDAIVPNQQFAGGGFLGNPALADRGLINNAFEGGGTNFLNREAIPLTGTGVLLFGPNSLIPNLRSSPFQGQANFINPGLLLFNAGMDAKITPKLRSTINVNYLRFHRTEILEDLLFQGSIHKSIGVDSGFGLQYRPRLSENIVLTGGFGVLIPDQGFKNLYTGRTLFSSFVAVRFLF